MCQTSPYWVDSDVSCSLITHGNQLMPSVVTVQQTFIIGWCHHGNAICHKQCIIIKTLWTFYFNSRDPTTYEQTGNHSWCTGIYILWNIISIWGRQCQWIIKNFPGLLGRNLGITGLIMTLHRQTIHYFVIH